MMRDRSRKELQRVRARAAIRASVVVGWVLASASVIPACTDPVLEATVEEQGNETEGVPKGEFHRAGQRCTACHQEHGKASTPFALAGTIFAQPKRQVGVADVQVALTDSDGTKFTTKTNCVGNFFVKPLDWEPKFPILVEISKGQARRSMRSVIGRATDCAECHSGEVPPSDPFSQVGHIYLFSGDEPGSSNGAENCPVDPIRSGSP